MSPPPSLISPTFVTSFNKAARSVIHKPQPTQMFITINLKHSYLTEYLNTGIWRFQTLCMNCSAPGRVDGTSHTSPGLYRFKEKESCSLQCQQNSIGKIGLHGNKPYLQCYASSLYSSMELKPCCVPKSCIQQISSYQENSLRLY